MKWRCPEPREVPEIRAAGADPARCSVSRVSKTGLIVCDPVTNQYLVVNVPEGEPPREVPKRRRPILPPVPGVQLRLWDDNERIKIGVPTDQSETPI